MGAKAKKNIREIRCADLFLPVSRPKHRKKVLRECMGEVHFAFSEYFYRATSVYASYRNYRSI